MGNYVQLFGMVDVGIDNRRHAVEPTTAGTQTATKKAATVIAATKMTRAGFCGTT